MRKKPKPKLKVNLIQGRTGKNDPIRRSKMAEDDTRERLPLRRRNIVIPFLVVSGLIFVTLSLLRSGTPKIQTVQVSPVVRETLTTTVLGTGTTKAANTRSIAFSSTGIVRSVTVDVGDTVSKGQVLAELDTTRTERELAVAEASLNSSQAALKRAKSEVTTAQLEHRKRYRSAQMNLASAQDGYREAQRELRLQQDLLKTGVVSPQEVRKAQTALNEAKRKVQNTQAEIQFAKLKVDNKDTSSIAQAQASYKSALVSVQNLQKTIGDAVLRSPTSGVVSAINVKVDNSTPSGTAFEITDPSSVYLEVPFDETRAVELETGQPATIDFDALKSPMHGKVTRISPTAQKTGQTANVLVHVRLAEPLEVKPGFTGTAEVTTKRLRNVMTVPLEATSEKDGVYIVWRVGQIQQHNKTGIALPIEVDLLERNNHRAAISGPVMPDDLIITPAPTKIQKEDPIQFTHSELSTSGRTSTTSNAGTTP